VPFKNVEDYDLLNMLCALKAKTGVGHRHGNASVTDEKSI